MTEISRTPVAVMKDYICESEIKALKLIDDADSEEEKYFKCGLFYHGTTFPIRRSHISELRHSPISELVIQAFEFPASELVIQAFEFTTSEECDAYLAPYKQIVTLAQEVRNLADIHGTPQVLQERCQKISDLLSFAQDLLYQISIQQERLAIWTQGLVFLQQDTPRGFLWDSPGVAMLQPEWQSFCRWLGAFLETQKMVQAGASVEKVAWDWLYNKQQGFEQPADNLEDTEQPVGDSVFPRWNAEDY
jgi:hypothetical protein